MRYFNTEGLCRPEEHYMVQLDDRMEQIKTLFVDRKKYFVINRGRQYGKTTTLRALEEYLKEDYIVLSLDFQEIESESLRTAFSFHRRLRESCIRHSSMSKQRIKRSFKTCCQISEKRIRAVG